MKILLLLTTLLIVSSCQKKILKEKDDENTTFTILQREKYLEYREDSTYWDTEILFFDLEGINDQKGGPFTYGAFPTPKYDLIGKGTFTGLEMYAYTGSEDHVKKIKDKTILFNSFFVKNSEMNKKHLHDKKDEIFFQIIVLTDTIDAVNYTHFRSEIISRNHPDYLGQGFFKTKNNIIDYVAFVTADRNSYAIVNTRLFDLNFGTAILIAPQKDRSLRTMQIKLPVLTSEDINSYTDSLLKKPKVIDFFTKQGNI